MTPDVKKTLSPIGKRGLVLISIAVLPGWAYWMWISLKLRSPGMFLFGILGPGALPASFVGLWSLLHGAPHWLLQRVG
jgi:hypothetical protein